MYKYADFEPIRCNKGVESMKRKITAILSALLVAILACSVFVTTTTAATASISYSFANKDRGFAEGTISLSGGSGSISLYWADDSKALEHFDPIATFNGSGSYTMPAYTAIPARATKIIGVSGSNKNVSSAVAVYNIPDNKKLGKTNADLLYSFASYSDIHMEADGVKPYNGYTAKYPYDEQHLKSAFNTAAARGVDFIVTTGDHVNNQRNDLNSGNNNLYAYEWNRYLHILAESDYVNPIYEAIGNHELWNYETDAKKSPRDWKSGSRYFVAMTGLDSTTASVNSDKAYYEITEPVTGDHFLFMALEGGFYTDANDEFSDAQLNWLEQKLNAYKNDGKNTFIMEHANFYKWGAGDQLDKPIYDIPLKFGNAATTRLKNILVAHPEAVIITGHTHFKYSLQLNYSNDNGGAATMLHNSSIGGVRDIKNRTTRINDSSLENTEGYIVEVYDNATIFYGTNVYSNTTYPWATYIVPQSTSSQEQKQTDAPTQPPTQPPTKAPETQKPTYGPPPTNPVSPTQPAPSILWGDVDDDGTVTVLDANCIQRNLAGLTKLDKAAIERGRVTGDSELTILDATCIQRKLAGIIKSFPVEDKLASTGAQAEIVDAASADEIEIAEVGAEEVEIVEEAAAVELEEAGADLNTLRSQASAALSKYWELASYNQYLALKKAYRQNADFDTLSAAYNSFNQAVKDFYPGDNITVRFKAPSGWGSIYAYAYNSDSDKIGNWPGKSCTKSGDYWSISLPIGKYNYIIFTDNNGHQTIDLALGITRNQGYTADSGSKVKAYPYQY